MQFCSNALIPADVGACGSLYYAWLGLPLLPCQKHIPDDHPHGFVISIMWTQMLAAYRLLRQKISNIVSHFNLLCVLPVVWSLSDDADYSWYPLQRHH